MVTPRSVVGKILGGPRHDVDSKNYLDVRRLVGKKVTPEQEAQLYNQWKYSINSEEDEKDLGKPIPNRTKWQAEAEADLRKLEKKVNKHDLWITKR
jgi:hypothetical protein